MRSSDFVNAFIPLRRECIHQISWMRSSWMCSSDFAPDQDFDVISNVIPTNHREIPGSTPGRYNLQIEITSKSWSGEPETPSLVEAFHAAFYCCSPPSHRPTRHVDPESLKRDPGSCRSLTRGRLDSAWWGTQVIEYSWSDLMNAFTA